MFAIFSSRPGRPPKRGVPFPPMSPQDAMLHLKNSMQHAGVAAAAAANGTSPGSNQAISGMVANSIPLKHTTQKTG